MSGSISFGKVIMKHLFLSQKNKYKKLIPAGETNPAFAT